MIHTLLQNLPDDYIGYYEPLIQDRYPDFVLICPDLGLLVIEVKGWYPGSIVGADMESITIKDRGENTFYKHPLRQARDYMLSIMDSCRGDSRCRSLFHSSGPHSGRFIFPFGHFAVLSNITSDQLKKHQIGDLTPVFQPSRVVPRDVFSDWEGLPPEQLSDVFRSFFYPFWTFPRLEQHQVDLLRAVIHPEQKEDLFDLKVLDARQENNARNIGNGHRLIYGVAGSGKTVLLISRAKISAQDPDAKVLVLCLNVNLAAYLKRAFQGYRNIDAYHFDGWAKKNGIARKWKSKEEGESNESLGNRLLQHLQQSYGDSRVYDAVLIDEAQDFEGVWFQYALEAMKEPLDGDLMIVGDAGQGLYPKGHISWKSIGIQAQGRAVFRKFDLDENYRNSREILEAAALFSPEANEDDDDINAIPVNPEFAVRRTGIHPMLMQCSDRRDECNRVVDLVRELMKGRWGSKPCKPLEPHSIGILYPLIKGSNRRIFSGFLEQLREVAPVVWLSDKDDRNARWRIDDEGVKVQTIHSAKGLQYPAVILMWADELPGADREMDKKLMYVALTRPEDFLGITFSGRSEFIDLLSKADSPAPQSTS